MNNSGQGAGSGYLFTSQRLGFRDWKIDDLSVFASLNADPEVMEHFPKTLSAVETAALIKRFQEHFIKYGYNYYATDVLATGELIGFIGMAYQTYLTEYTPATDIGWRLKKSAWGHGYATEGAKRCLKHAFHVLNLPVIISTCTINNHRSEKVMKKIGMTRAGLFDHPRLNDYPEYQSSVCYKITQQDYAQLEDTQII